MLTACAAGEAATGTLIDVGVAETGVGAGAFGRVVGVLTGVAEIGCAVGTGAGAADGSTLDKGCVAALALALAPTPGVPAGREGGGIICARPESAGRACALDSFALTELDVAEIADALNGLEGAGPDPDPGRGADRGVLTGDPNGWRGGDGPNCLAGSACALGLDKPGARLVPDAPAPAPAPSFILAAWARLVPGLGEARTEPVVGGMLRG